MAGTITLTWLGDVVLRIKTLTQHYILIPKKTITITTANESATKSALLVNLARLGLFAEIDPSVIPDTLGATPLTTASGDTDPSPFFPADAIKTQPYVLQ